MILPVDDALLFKLYRAETDRPDRLKIYRKICRTNFSISMTSEGEQNDAGKSERDVEIVIDLVLPLWMMEDE